VVSALIVLTLLSSCCILDFDFVRYRDVMRVCPGIPVVLVGNKVDERDRKVKCKQITYHRGDRGSDVRPPRAPFPYYDLSAKANYNFEAPFLSFARQLLGDNSLRFVDTPAPAPPPPPPAVTTAEAPSSADMLTLTPRRAF